MAEEDFSSVPSSMRKPRAGGKIEEEREAEVNIAEPPVPRPSMQMPKVPEMPKLGMEMPKFSLGAGGGIGLPLIAVALVALLSLYMAWSAGNQVGMMKAETKLLAQDLKAFKDRDVSIRAPVDGVVTVRKDVPLAGVFPLGLTATGTIILPVKATLVGRSTTGSVFEIPIEQNVTVDFEAPLDFSKTGANENIVIDEEIPLGNEAIIKVNAGEVWGPDLDAAIGRLETISK